MHSFAVVNFETLREIVFVLDASAVCTSLMATTFHVPALLP